MFLFNPEKKCNKGPAGEMKLNEKKKTTSSTATRKRHRLLSALLRYVIFHVGFMNVCVVLYKNKLKPTNG